MMAHNPHERISLPDVLKMPEKAESTELGYSQLEKQSDSTPEDAAGLIETNSNEELLTMNEERLQLKNVEVKLEF